MSDEATFIGLVYDYITKDKERSHTTSFVPGYFVYRRWRGPLQDHFLNWHDQEFVYRDYGTQGAGIYKRIFIGPHMRHKALYGNLRRALPCVCKFERLR